MAKKRLITQLKFRDQNEFNLGDELFGRIVDSISFRDRTHQTTGSAGRPCYVAKFVDSTVQMVVPREAIKWVLTDEAEPAAQEDGAVIPDLPEE
jgi:hypothetical protein